MDIEKTKTQMRKGILEYCILSIIQKNGDAYASDLLDELKKSEMIVVEGTIYPLLTRLKNEELLAYRWEESTSGPPRKYFTLTDKGAIFLNELSKTWLQLKQAVNRITQENTQNG
ncbi:MAG TPA: PadR family transcriptional regulator [Moheibacter sp.]|nr:PadR family transcriptional regulator [Moheibacter sp.]